MIRGYEDKTFVLVASGPSLTQEQVDQCRGKAQIVVINDNYKIAPFADHLYACDQTWWLWHEDDPELLAFKGKKWTQTSSWDDEIRKRIRKKHDLTFIQSKAEPGLSTDPNIIHQGSNSGYQAINLAYHLGAKKILLIGYDMQRTNDKAHWFGDHPDKGQTNYSKFTKYYNTLAKQDLDVEIINCTTQTALTCFPRKELKDVL